MHTLFLPSSATAEWQPIITHPPAKELWVSKAAHTVLTCSGKCITAAAQPTLCLISFYKTLQYVRLFVWKKHGGDEVNSTSYYWGNACVSVIGYERYPSICFWFRFMCVLFDHTLLCLKARWYVSPPTTNWTVFPGPSIGETRNTLWPTRTCCCGAASSVTQRLAMAWSSSQVCNPVCLRAN